MGRKWAVHEETNGNGRFVDKLASEPFSAHSYAGGNVSWILNSITLSSFVIHGDSLYNAPTLL